MADADRLLGAIESIYAAGLDEARWPEALRATAAFTGSIAATIEVFQESPMAMNEFRVAGLPSQAEIAYLDHYSRHNPRAGYAFRHLSQRFIADYQVLDETSMDRDEYYAKYLKPIGLRYFLSGQLFNTHRQQAVVTIQRTRRQGHVGRAELGKLRHLVPHFRRAHEMTARMRGARGTHDLVEQAIDWLADGVALLGADGSVLHANAALVALARAADGIRLAESRMEFMGAAERTRFETAIGAAMRLHAGEPDAPFADFLVRRPSGAPPYVVSVRPLVQGREDRSRRRAPRRSSSYATRSRTTLATVGSCGTFSGSRRPKPTLPAPCGPAPHRPPTRVRRPSPPNTAYTHLRRIKEKTGTRRMADLIHRLNEAHIGLRRG